MSKFVFNDSKKARKKLNEIAPSMVDFLADIYSGLVDKSIKIVSGKMVEDNNKLSVWENGVKRECKRLLTEVCDHEG